MLFEQKGGNTMSSSKRDMLSQRRIDGFLKYAEIIQYGRQNPVWFIETFLGIELLDYQKYVIMGSWTTPFVVWTKSRAAGKSTLGAVFIMAKAMLTPNHQTYILAGTGSQSQEMFLKMEQITMNQLASFTGLTDVFLGETVKSQSNKTGFTHNPASFEVSLYNGSTINSLNSIPDNIRSKRSNLNFYDESGFTADELFEASEPFAVQSSDFRLGGDTDVTLLPKQTPNQLIYASSASATDTYYYRKYRDFAQKMFLGDSRYFVADIDSDAVINATYNGKLFPVSLLSQETVDAAMRDNKEKAMREYKNIFTTEGSDLQIIKRAMIVRNSHQRVPVLSSNGNRKFIFAVDPARSHDNSILTIAELIDDPDVGYKLEIVNIISFADLKQKKKTPMQTPEQIREFKQTLLDYNGQKATDYENIEQVLIDAGAGGAGVSAWGDGLLADWDDKNGRTRRGLIDKNHDEYKEYIGKYPNAYDNVTLVSPQKHKRAMFESLIEMMKQDLISFPESYDGKGEINFTNLEGSSAGKTTRHKLTDDEITSLVNIDLAKEELVSIYGFKSSNGNMRYDLPPDKQHKMNDDRAYTIAMLAWYLHKLRRQDITKEPEFRPEDHMIFMSSGF